MYKSKIKYLYIAHSFSIIKRISHLLYFLSQGQGIVPLLETGEKPVQQRREARGTEVRNSGGLLVVTWSSSEENEHKHVPSRTPKVMLFFFLFFFSFLFVPHDKCISSLLRENRECKGSMTEQDACVGVTSRKYCFILLENFRT